MCTKCSLGLVPILEQALMTSDLDLNPCGLLNFYMCLHDVVPESIFPVWPYFRHKIFYVDSIYTTEKNGVCRLSRSLRSSISWALGTLCRAPHLANVGTRQRLQFTESCQKKKKLGNAKTLDQYTLCRELVTWHSTTRSHVARRPWLTAFFLLPVPLF